MAKNRLITVKSVRDAKLNNKKYDKFTSAPKKVQDILLIGFFQD